MPQQSTPIPSYEVPWPRLRRFQTAWPFQHRALRDPGAEPPAVVPAPSTCTTAGEIGRAPIARGYTSTGNHTTVPSQQGPACTVRPSPRPPRKPHPQTPFTPPLIMALNACRHRAATLCFIGPLETPATVIHFSRHSPPPTAHQLRSTYSGSQRTPSEPRKWPHPYRSQSPAAFWPTKPCAGLALRLPHAARLHPARTPDDTRHVVALASPPRQGTRRGWRFPNSFCTAKRLANTNAAVSREPGSSPCRRHARPQSTPRMTAYGGLVCSKVELAYESLRTVCRMVTLRRRLRQPAPPRLCAVTESYMPLSSEPDSQLDNTATIRRPNFRDAK